jgi:tetratricopeptide (TPR) repeat protein
VPDLIERLQEGRRYESHGVLDRALECYRTAAEESVDPSLIAESLTHQSRVYRCQSDWSHALDAARRAQEIARSARLGALWCDAIIAEANVLMCRGDFTEALALFNQVLETTDTPRVRGIALQNIGSIQSQLGELDAAELSFAESFGCFHSAGYQLGEAIALNNHGRIALDRGNTDLAMQQLEQALTAARAVEDAELVALVTLNYAETLNARGDRLRAADEASTALGYFATSGNRWREVECLRLIGGINERLGDYPDAVRCYQRALDIAQEIGARQDITIVRDCLARVEGRARRPEGGDRSAAPGQ